MKRLALLLFVLFAFVVPVSAQDGLPTQELIDSSVMIFTGVMFVALVAIIAYMARINGKSASEETIKAMMREAREMYQAGYRRADQYVDSTPTNVDNILLDLTDEALAKIIELAKARGLIDPDFVLNPSPPEAKG